MLVRKLAAQCPSWNFIGIDIKDTFVNEAVILATPPAAPNLSSPLVESDNQPTLTTKATATHPHSASGSSSSSSSSTCSNTTIISSCSSSVNNSNNNLYYEFNNANVHLCALLANYPGTVAAATALFPDPRTQKRRFRKRRMLTGEFLLTLSDILGNGGTFSASTV